MGQQLVLGLRSPGIPVAFCVWDSRHENSGSGSKTEEGSGVPIFGGGRHVGLGARKLLWEVRFWCRRGRWFDRCCRRVVIGSFTVANRSATASECSHDRDHDRDDVFLYCDELLDWKFGPVAICHLVFLRGFSGGVGGEDENRCLRQKREENLHLDLHSGGRYLLCDYLRIDRRNREVLQQRLHRRICFALPIIKFL